MMRQQQQQHPQVRQQAPGASEQVPAAAVPKLPPLRELNLASNRITLNAAESLVELLLSCPQLARLDLAHNRLGLPGLAAVCGAVRQLAAEGERRAEQPPQGDQRGDGQEHHQDDGLHDGDNASSGNATQAAGVRWLALSGNTVDPAQADELFAEHILPLLAPPLEIACLEVNDPALPSHHLPVLTSLLAETSSLRKLSIQLEKTCTSADVQSLANAVRNNATILALGLGSRLQLRDTDPAMASLSNALRVNCFMWKVRLESSPPSSSALEAPLDADPAVGETLLIRSILHDQEATEDFSVEVTEADKYPAANGDRATPCHVNISAGNNLLHCPTSPTSHVSGKLHQSSTQEPGRQYSNYHASARRENEDEVDSKLCQTFQDALPAFPNQGCPSPTSKCQGSPGSDRPRAIGDASSVPTSSPRRLLSAAEVPHLLLEEGRLQQLIEHHVDARINQLREDLVQRMTDAEEKATLAANLVREEVKALTGPMEKVAHADVVSALQERVQTEMSELSTSLRNLTSAFKDTGDRLERSDTRVASLATQLAQLEEYTHNECVKKKGWNRSVLRCTGIDEITRAFNCSISVLEDSAQKEGELLRHEIQRVQVRTDDCEHAILSKYGELDERLKTTSKPAQEGPSYREPTTAFKAKSSHTTERELGRLRRTVRALIERVDMLEQALRYA
eukprot:scaffold138_cov396-Prasinococcus_capsulatus_cf.AAC.4